MRVVKVLGHLALVKDTYVKIGNSIYRDEWIVGVGHFPEHRDNPDAFPEKMIVQYGDGGTSTHTERDNAEYFADALALYERRLAAATEGDVNDDGNDCRAVETPAR